MRCRFRCWCIVVSVAIAPSFPVLVVAQSAAQSSTSGAIRGYVRDDRGVVLAAVAITASRTASSDRSTASTGTGEYRLTDLPPGTYTVRAELQGFEACVRQGIRVDARRTLGLDFTLRHFNA
jgi:hypothetical protein